MPRWWKGQTHQTRPEVVRDARIRVGAVAGDLKFTTTERMLGDGSSSERG